MLIDAKETIQTATNAKTTSVNIAACSEGEVSTGCISPGKLTFFITLACFYSSGCQLTMYTCSPGCRPVWSWNSLAVQFTEQNVIFVAGGGAPWCPIDLWIFNLSLATTYLPIISGLLKHGSGQHSYRSFYLASELANTFLIIHAYILA